MLALQARYRRNGALLESLPSYNTCEWELGNAFCGLRGGLPCVGPWAGSMLGSRGRAWMPTIAGPPLHCCSYIGYNQFSGKGGAWLRRALPCCLHRRLH